MSNALYYNVCKLNKVCIIVHQESYYHVYKRITFYIPLTSTGPNESPLFIVCIMLVFSMREHDFTSHMHSFVLLCVFFPLTCKCMYSFYAIFFFFESTFYAIVIKCIIGFACIYNYIVNKFGVKLKLWYLFILLNLKN
jgi:hypothetical protein